MMNKGNKRNIGFIIIGIVLVIGFLFSSALVETVEKGTYQVKQAAVSGNMSAKMTPGLWAQFFGDIEVWPKANTFFFTSDVFIQYLYFFKLLNHLIIAKTNTGLVY